MCQNFAKKIGPNLDQDCAGHEKGITILVGFSKPSPKAIFKLEIHAATFQPIHSSLTSPWKSPRAAHVRSPKFWTLCAAQVPWRFWDLKACGNPIFSLIFCSRNFTKRFMVFIKIRKIHHHELDLRHVQLFLQQILWKLLCWKSESSYKTVVLDTRKLKTTGTISSSDQKCAKILQKNLPKSWPR